MQLIKQIEISYLRSLYKAKFETTGDLNLIFGRNDSGKSNVLRALNLFFTGETDADTDPDFDIDLSDIRREEARRGQRRQFFAIRVVFNIPPNYRKSLGDEVAIKRQWNIDGEMSETLPRGMTKGARIQLTKFLNSIDFTYVPAIKDSEVFANLIQRMYEATAQGAGLKIATQKFVGSIRTETAELSEGLTSILGASASLAAPTEMGLLFRSLDFSHGENEHSLLLQKGDGVKARHIPELLKYINSKETGKKFFVWGFEEPENSLDLSNADAEAKRFATVSSRNDTQVFITSHSPAFYLASPENGKQVIRRYFISKQGPDEEGEVRPINAVSQIDNPDQAEEKMREASLLQLPFLIKKWGELKDENQRLSEVEEGLRRQMAAARVPRLYVEGLHDKNLFTSAIRRNKSEIEVTVSVLEGTPSDTAELIRRVIDAGGTLSSVATLFLFDNDKAGRSAFENLTKTKLSLNTPARVAGGISAWTLPCSEEILDFRTRYGIREDQLFYPAEFLFPGASAAELCLSLMNDDDIAKSRNTIHDAYHRSLQQERAAPLRLAEPGTADWLWARGVPDNLKERFFSAARRTLDTAHLDQVVGTALDRLAEQPPQ